MPLLRLKAVNMKRHSLVAFAGLLALLAAGGAQAQNMNNILDVEITAGGASQFALLETASYIEACSKITELNGEHYSVRDYTSPQNSGYQALGIDAPTALQLIQNKIDCLHRLVDADMLCNIDSLDAAATTCTAYYNGNPHIMILDTLHFKCNGYTKDDGGNIVAVCPFSDTSFKDLTNINYNANVAACVAEYSVLGFTGCSQSALCAYVADTDSIGFGPYCPNQLDGKMCCGQDAARINGVDFNTIDIFNDGAGIKPGVSHVVDLDVDISYTISDPARLKVDITVPYVTETSFINVTVGESQYAYKMCPSTYLIDMKDPLEGRPAIPGIPGTDRMRDTAVRGGSATADNWLPLTYLPKSDSAGTPRSSCANYDFNLDSGTNVNRMRAYLDYPGSLTYTDDSGSYDTVMYGAVPSFNNYARTVWETYIADSNGNGLVPGKDIGGGQFESFWNKGTPAAGRITYSTGDWDVVRGWAQCKATYDDAKLVTKTSETDAHVVNGVAYDVDSYSWTFHVCQFGRYGETCGDNDASIITYAKSCARYPASFALSPQQIADVSVSPVNAAVTAKVFLQSVVGSGNVKSGCAAGFERFVITMNLVFFETATDSALIIDENVHDLISPVSMFSGSTSELPLNVVGGETPPINVREFLQARRETSEGIVEGIFVLGEQDQTIDSANPYRYQKVIMVTKCYDTKFDSTRGTRGKPNRFAEVHADGNTNSIMLETQLIAQNFAETKRTALNLRILASAESFHLPTAEVMEAKEIQATQTVFGSYAKAREGNAGDALTDQQTLRPDAQLCSKHQIDESHAAVAHLTPNSVGACILKTGISQSILDLAGTTIQYIAVGMREVQTYTFGCFDDWINTDGVSTQTCENGVPAGCDPVLNGGAVYVFSGVAQRLTGDASALAGSYWFVANGDLNTALIATGDLNPDNLKLHDIFGTGMFTFDYAVGNHRYYYRVSDEMQLSSTDRTNVGATGSSSDGAPGVKHQSMTPGCDSTDGNLKSACNLVCFNAKRGLLTPTSGTSQLVIHHVSVAEFATVEEAINANTHISGARRRLLETVTVAGSGAVVGNASTPAGMTMFKIQADPRDATGTSTSNSSSTTVTVEDDDDDANVGMIVGIVVGASALIAAIVIALSCCGGSSNRKPRGYSSLEEPMNTAYGDHKLRRRM